MEKSRYFDRCADRHFDGVMGCRTDEHGCERHFPNSRNRNCDRYDPYGFEADGKGRYGALGNVDRIRCRNVYGRSASQ